MLVGDKILSSSERGLLLFADVAAIPHPRNDILTRFVSLTTESGNELKLTGDHLLPSSDCSAGDLKLSRAVDLAVGSCVLTTSGVSKVSAINEVIEAGIYTVVTQASYIVVNGVVASPFAVSHWLAHWYYDIYRIAYSLVPSVMRSEVFINLHYFISDLVTLFE